MNNSQCKIEDLLPQLELYSEEDPAKFEAIRQELIETTISSFPEKHQQRARGIQFALDCELQKYKHPVARMNRMVELFWEKFDEFQTAVNNPSEAIAERETRRKPAKVISMF